MEDKNLSSFTDVLSEEIASSQPFSLSSKSNESITEVVQVDIPPETNIVPRLRPAKHTGQYGEFRSIDEIDQRYRSVFSYPYFNLVQSRIIEDALYSDKSLVVSAPTGSGKTVVFEMAIVRLLMEREENNDTDDFKIIYMAPVKAVCTERLAEWHAKFCPLGLLCIEVTGDTDVDFSQLKSYSIIITTPEKWDLLTRRWSDRRGLAGVVKLFLIDEVHILNDAQRGPVLEAVVSRMKTIEASSQSAYRIEQLQKQHQEQTDPEFQTTLKTPPKIRFVAVSATVDNPEDVAEWLSSKDQKAVVHKFGEECRPVRLRRVVAGFPCSTSTSIFKFDLTLSYKLWPIIQKYYDGKPTLIFCNTRKSVMMTAETLARELTVSFSPDQKAKLVAIASNIKNKKIQMLVATGVGCHHAGLLLEERASIEQAFRHGDLPILITTTTLAMGVNLPAHLVIIKNTQQYVNGGYQEYSINTVLQMVGRAGRGAGGGGEATAVIMTRTQDKARYESLVGGSEPLQSYLHKRLAENLNCEAALGTVGDVAQCVQWLRSTFLFVRAARDPRGYLGLPVGAPTPLILKKIEELCVKAMNGLATAGLITMDEACCIEPTAAGRLMSHYYLDFDTMKLIMKVEGTETLEEILRLLCGSQELGSAGPRGDERRGLNALNRSSTGPHIRFPMKGKITTREMKVNCIVQAALGCLPLGEPALQQEAARALRVADRLCGCLVAYVTRPDILSTQPRHFSAILNSIILAKCVSAQLWENSPYLSRQLRGIGPTYSTLLASAGKTSFRLLQESHPRDLERIINKGAPAGNVLHKQILLLPNYQITLTPIDERSVKVEVLLSNQHYLAEHGASLTAGDQHKCYVVVGDSENHLLLLNTFKDRDLISMNDGCITFNITRRHRFEHKIFVHCVSSTFVGLDVENEYIFKDLDPIPSINRDPFYQTIPTQNNPRKIPTKKQTTITDTFKERKRKANDLDICQSKEKKKRDLSILERFRYLKESLNSVANEIKGDMNRYSERNPMAFNEITNKECGTESIRTDTINKPNDFVDEPSTSGFITNYNRQNDKLEVVEDSDYDIDDGKFDSIMNEIESEIKNNKKDYNVVEDEVREPITYQNKAPNSKSKNNIDPKDNNFNIPKVNARQQIEIKHQNTIDSYFPKKDNNQQQKHMYQPRNQSTLPDTHKQTRYKYSKNKPNNYNFIEKIEKTIDEGDSPKAVNNTNKETGFSDAIKNEIQKFLQKAQSTVATKDNVLEQLMLSQKEPQKKITSENEQNTEKPKLSKEIGAEVCWVEKSAPTPTDKHKIHVDVEEDKNVLKNDAQIAISLEDNFSFNSTLSMLPDVILVHGHNKPDCEIEKVKGKEPSKNHQNITASKYQDVICLLDGPLKRQKTYMEDQLFPAFENKQHEIEPNNGNERQNLDKGINEVVKIKKDKEREGSFDGNMSNQKSVVPYCYGRIGTVEDDVIMLSDKSREDYNNISQGFNKITLTDNADQPRLSKAIEPTSCGQNIDYYDFTKERDYKTIGTSQYESTTNNKKKEVTEPMEDIEYTRRFSYTKTKVDICTKRSDSKKITLKTIQKMKVDLDITQIVSVENNNSSKKENIQEVNCPNFNASYNDLVSKTPVFQRKPIQDEDTNFESIYSICDRRQWPLASYLPVKSAPVYRSSDNPKSNDNLIKLRRQEQDNEQGHANNNNEVDNITLTPKNKDGPLSDSIPHERHVNFKCKHETVSETKQELKATSDRGITSVEDILKKYAQKLKAKPTPSQVIQNPKVSKESQQPLKPKRPFRIKEIQNIKAQIPATIQDLINSTSSPVNHNEPIATVTKEKTPEKHIPDAIEKESCFVLPEIDHSEFPDVLERDENMSQVDHSMFDPKMLLEQYYKSNDDEEYIPPPPQFCDEEVYSPKLVDNPMEDILDDGRYLKEESIYEEISNFNELMETKDKTEEKLDTEIETWTISQEDRIESNYPSDLLYSGVKRRRDFSSAARYSQGTSTRAKLGQFKFGKNKFTARRF